jgi:ornithine cyclodeaminase
MPTLTLTEDEIRQAISTAEAVETIETAFATMTQKLAYLPDAINLNLPSVEGEAQVKGAYTSDTPYFIVKVANRFYSNPSVGLPVGSGLVLAFDAATGFLAAILLDNGYLTDLRTGAAGAVAVRHLAPATIRQVAFIGAGTQARFQFRAIATVRDIPSVIAWSRNPANADRFVGEIVDDAGCEVHVAQTIQEAVSSSDLVITATPSRHALVFADWVRPGATLIAVGSDTPDKQELDPDVLTRADMVITDSLSQCTKIGEIHHALTAGLLSLDGVTGELGEVVTGRIPGRTAADQIIVCDLSGVAVLDASITTTVMEKSYFMGLGQRKRGRMEGYDLL